jgi:uncharacterized membrane protein YczE
MDRRHLTRAGCYAAGIPLVGAGIAVLLRSGTGVAPFDVANSGVAHTLGWSVGVASWAVSAVLLAAAFAAGRRPRPGTVVATFGIGLAIDRALAVVPAAGSPGSQVAFAAAGISMMWAGITLLVCADLGAGPAEELMLALVDRRWPLREVRWGIEITLTATGWALGGSVGPTTLAFAALTGPVLARLLPRASSALGLAPHLPDDGVPAELR